jgi:hypothetical protein
MAHHRERSSPPPRHRDAALVAAPSNAAPVALSVISVALHPQNVFGVWFAAAVARASGNASDGSCRRGVSLVARVIAPGVALGCHTGGKLLVWGEYFSLGLTMLFCHEIYTTRPL